MPTKDQIDAAAERQRQIADQHRRQRMGEEDSTNAVLPFGMEMPDDWFDFTFDFLKGDEFLEKPEKLLANPNPNSKYGWPRTKDESAWAKVRKGIYRPVEKKELKTDENGKIVADGAIDLQRADQYVWYYDHFLVEITAEAYKRYFEAPAKWGAARLARREDYFRESIEKGSRGYAQGRIEKDATGRLK